MKFLDVINNSDTIIIIIIFNKRKTVGLYSIAAADWKKKILS